MSSPFAQDVGGIKSTASMGSLTCVEMKTSAQEEKKLSNDLSMITLKGDLLDFSSVNETKRAEGEWEEEGGDRELNNSFALF